MDDDLRCSTHRDLTVPTPCARWLRAEAARRWLGPPDVPAVASRTDGSRATTPVDDGPALSWLTAEVPT